MSAICVVLMVTLPDDPDHSVVIWYRLRTLDFSLEIVKCVLGTFVHIVYALVCRIGSMVPAIHFELQLKL